ncbi:phosphotransferase family protein [Paenarthrobacter nitroguajacolicus]|uniref:phosphotransferase family protein n=1 Tax=Paenarthrobacter nitroguajacolicus TaxID=211146 RepID=UPI003AD88A42
MNDNDSLQLLAGTLGLPIHHLEPIVHAGDGRLFRIPGLGIAKLYESGSDKLRSALAAAKRISDAGLTFSPRLLDVVEFGESDVAVIFEYIEGAHPPNDFLNVCDHRADLTLLLDTLHSNHADQFSRAPFTSSSSFSDWPSFLRSQLEKIPVRFLERTGSPAESFLYEAIEYTRATLSDAHDLLLRVQPSLVHRDVSARNLLIPRKGGLMLLDFDLAAYYDPFFDFVKLDLFNPPSSKNSWEALVKGYCLQTETDVDEAFMRIGVCRSLELLWGYPALIAMGSSAADTWKHQIQELVEKHA